jgi:hypothetical protein
LAREIAAIDAFDLDYARTEFGKLACCVWRSDRVFQGDDCYSF